MKKICLILCVCFLMAGCGKYTVKDAEKDLEKKIREILEQLTVEDDNYFPKGLFPYIPQGTEVLNVLCGEKQVSIDFSKEFLNMSVDLEKQIVSGIVYSILDLDDIQEVIILVEGQLLKEYPNTHEALPSPLTRDIGINKEYNITSIIKTSTL